MIRGRYPISAGNGILGANRTIGIAKTEKRFDLARALQINDPRDVPAYSVSEAARYLCMPAQTISAWVRGTTYTHRGESHAFKPVIPLSDTAVNLLTFFNLAEVHVLRALRTTHMVQLQAIRKALQFVQERYGWQRPLLTRKFKTDGVALFVEALGKVVDVTPGGQTVMEDVIAHLDRIEWEGDLASRLYPFTRTEWHGAPRSVLIDPRYSFGRPILSRARVCTSVIAERYKAGDSVEDLADDYGCNRLEIEEGMRCEFRLDAA